MKYKTVKAQDVLAAAKAVAKSLEINYFYLDILAYENISTSRTDRLISSLTELSSVMKAYKELSTAEQTSIENDMPFMISD